MSTALQSEYTPGELLSSGVYLILCIVTGKAYVGSTKQFKQRWSQHWLDLNNNRHCNAKLQNAWNKHGKEQFQWVILEHTADLLKAEQFWLDEFQTYRVGFNLCPRAGSPAAGIPWSSTHKAKMQPHLERLREAPRSQAQLEHAMHNLKELVQTPERKSKTSQHMTAYNKAHPYRHVWTDEQREKLRVAQLQRWARKRGE